MEKKIAMRILAMVCVIILCVPMMLTCVSAASAGDGKEPAVFLLAFVNDEDDVIFTSAFYMQDTLGDGSTYLVSAASTASLVESGYGCMVMGLNYTELATLVTTSGGFAFYKAPGLENMVPMKTGGAVTSSVDITCAQMSADGITGTESTRLDISDWTSVNGGMYAPGTELSSVMLLGAPVTETSNGTVVGCFSMTNNAEYAIITMEGFEFPSNAAIVQGSGTTQQPAETQAPAAQPQQQEPQQQEPQQQEPQQQEPQQSEGTVNTSDVAFVVFVVVIAAWFIIKNNKKKKKSQKTEAQAGYKPVQEGTIMLDSNSNKPAAEQPAVIGMPAPSWQVRGLAGPLEGKVFILDPRGVRTMKFGRDPGCDVAFPPNTPGISGLHCELVQERGGIALRDLQSSYGTYMGNHVHLEPNVNYHLREGDEFMLAQGGQVFRLERWGNVVQNYTPAVRSVVDDTIYRADQNGRMVFGRDPRNQVTFDVNDSSVSSTHCVLYRENGALYLMDKDSTNGTYFDEKQRLRPNVPYKVKKGMSFFLTSPKYTFVITED